MSHKARPLDEEVTIRCRRQGPNHWLAAAVGHEQWQQTGRSAEEAIRKLRRRITNALDLENAGIFLDREPVQYQLIGMDQVVYTWRREQGESQ